MPLFSLRLWIRHSKQPSTSTLVVVQHCQPDRRYPHFVYLKLQLLLLQSLTSSRSVERLGSVGVPGTLIELGASSKFKTNLNSHTVRSVLVQPGVIQSICKLWRIATTGQREQIEFFKSKSRSRLQRASSGSSLYWWHMRSTLHFKRCLFTIQSIKGISVLNMLLGKF